MTKPPIRTKSIGTKLTEAEYASLESRASRQGLKLSEWVREVLLSSLNGKSESNESGESGALEIVLAEVLAFRMILINMFFKLSKEAMSDEQMRELIARADGEKLRRAVEHLSAMRDGIADRSSDASHAKR